MKEEERLREEEREREELIAREKEAAREARAREKEEAARNVYLIFKSIQYMNGSLDILLIGYYTRLSCTLLK